MICIEESENVTEIFLWHLKNYFKNYFKSVGIGDRFALLTRLSQLTKPVAQLTNGNYASLELSPNLLLEFGFLSLLTQLLFSPC